MKRLLVGVRPALKYKKVIRSKSTATPMASVTYDKKNFKLPPQNSSIITGGFVCNINQMNSDSISVEQSRMNNEKINKVYLIMKDF